KGKPARSTAPAFVGDQADLEGAAARAPPPHGKGDRRVGRARHAQVRPHGRGARPGGRARRGRAAAAAAGALRAPDPALAPVSQAPRPRRGGRAGRLAEGRGRARTSASRRRPRPWACARPRGRGGGGGGAARRPSRAGAAASGERRVRRRGAGPRGPPSPPQRPAAGRRPPRAREPRVEAFRPAQPKVRLRRRCGIAGLGCPGLGRPSWGQPVGARRDRNSLRQSRSSQKHFAMDLEDEENMSVESAAPSQG
ncbi:Hypothetical predicted protein, partial [Marmota monax]